MKGWICNGTNMPLRAGTCCGNHCSLGQWSAECHRLASHPHQAVHQVIAACLFCSPLPLCRRRLEEARQRYSALQAQLEGEASTLGSLEAKVSQLEGLRREGEARLKALGRDTEELRKEQFRAGQTLFELRSKEKELTSAIAGG